MIIRVGFLDNDFRSDVENICNDIMHDISQGYDGEDFIELFQEYLDKNGIKNLRERIVLGTAGFYIANCGKRGWFEKPNSDRLSYNTTLATFDKILKYIDEVVTVKQVKAYEPSDDNGETCYIDVGRKKVFVC